MNTEPAIKKPSSWFLLLLYLIPIIGYISICVYGAYTFNTGPMDGILFMVLTQLLCSTFIGFQLGKHWLPNIIYSIMLIVAFHFLAISFIPSVKDIQDPVLRYKCNKSFEFEKLEEFRIEIETAYQNGTMNLEDTTNRYRRPFSYSIIKHQNTYINEHFTEVGYRLKNGEIRYLIFFLTESHYTYAILWYPLGNKEGGLNSDGYRVAPYRINVEPLFKDETNVSFYFPLY